MIDHQTPEAICPWCGTPLNAATGVTCEDGPSEGDISICAKCCEILIFKEDLTLRKPTAAELFDMPDGVFGIQDSFRKSKELWEKSNDQTMKNAEIPDNASILEKLYQEQCDSATIVDSDHSHEMINHRHPTHYEESN